MEKIKYITNKELLIEINRSKMTYSYFKEPRFSRFDAIVHDISLITPAFISFTLQKRKELMQKQGVSIWGDLLPENINETDLVFRVMTNEHIPNDPNRKRRIKIPSDDGQVKTPFPAFKHYSIIDGNLTEVARSHWKGDLETGSFCIDHGKITNRLATMFMLLVERYSKRGNWRGYTYVDEMRGHALVQLSQTALLFDESKSDNPFAFYTTIIKNGFTRILNTEKKNQHIRDDLLIIGGAQPSYSRQIDHEIEQRFGDDQNINVPAGENLTSSKVVELPKKRGRKPKSQISNDGH